MVKCLERLLLFNIKLKNYSKSNAVFGSIPIYFDHFETKHLFNEDHLIIFIKNERGALEI